MLLLVMVLQQLVLLQVVLQQAMDLDHDLVKMR